MSIRFQADNDLKFGIVKAVRGREPTIDFVSAQEAGLDGSAILNCWNVPPRKAESWSLMTGEPWSITSARIWLPASPALDC